MGEREYCIICERKIYRAKGRDVLKQRRGRNCVTCCKKCSKIYRRVYEFVFWRITENLKNKGRKEK